MIASGGAGSYEHMRAAILEAGASAVAASSMFHFTQQTPAEAKRSLAIGRHSSSIASRHGTGEEVTRIAFRIDASAKHRYRSPQPLRHSRQGACSTRGPNHHDAVHRCAAVSRLARLRGVRSPPNTRQFAISPEEDARRFLQCTTDDGSFDWIVVDHYSWTRSGKPPFEVGHNVSWS